MPESGLGLGLAAARARESRTNQAVLLADRAQVMLRVVAAVVDDRAPVPQQRLALPTATQHVASPRQHDEAEGGEATGGDERHTLIAGEAAWRCSQ